MPHARIETTVSIGGPGGDPRRVLARVWRTPVHNGLFGPGGNPRAVFHVKVELIVGQLDGPDAGVVELPRLESVEAYANAYREQLGGSLAPEAHVEDVNVGGSAFSLKISAEPGTGEAATQVVDQVVSRMLARRTQPA